MIFRGSLRHCRRRNCMLRVTTRTILPRKSGRDSVRRLSSYRLPKTIGERSGTFAVVTSHTRCCFQGGPTWGDNPTDAFTHFSRLMECPPIWERLVEWAKADRGPQPVGQHVAGTTE